MLKQLTKFSLILTLAGVGVVAGITPELSLTRSRISFNLSNIALAQNYSPQELENYAKSLLAIELLRQSTYNEIKTNMNGSPIPEIRCFEPDSLQELPGNSRQIAVNYCNKSQEIVTSNGLTIERFNEITNNLQNNPEMKRQVQNTLIRIQQ